jgi:uncharacterized protein
MNSQSALPYSPAVSKNIRMNAPSYFEVQADEVQRTTRFYSEAFGWKFTRVEGIPVEYWRIETEGPRGGLLKRPAAAHPPMHGTNAFVCSMEGSDYDHVAGRIAKLGGTVALPKFAEPGMCWQGYFVDPEGNTFGIFQADEKAS